MSKLRVVALLSGLAAAMAVLASGAATPAETVKARPHHVYLIGSLRITQPWIDVTGAPGGDAPAYLTVENRGEGPDRLVGASVAGAASAAIVPASGADDGSGVPVPARGTVMLKPGEAHLAVRGLSGVTAASPPLEATLRFERAGSLHLSFTTDQAAAMRDDDSAPSDDRPVHLSQ